LLKVALNTKNQSINQTKKDPSMSWRENIWDRRKAIELLYYLVHFVSQKINKK
jgi:hypothetical protein